MPKIRLLPENIINKIAAGEILERPSSAIKELVENSKDAGATKIDVLVNNGGKNLISITDNGCGMTKDELELCIKRHATSKLDDDDLFNVKFLGFRGEALASIAAVSRLTISSCKEGAEDGWTMIVSGGKIESFEPCSITKGTRIEIRDLFFATPARLKFLKTDRTEISYIQDVLKKLALVHPSISFSLTTETRKLLDYKAHQGQIYQIAENRIADILGKDFIANSIAINLKKENITVTGYAALPTYNKSTNHSQYIFVNGRPVKDKTIQGIIRVAYQDYLANNRYPAIILYIDLDAYQVDVNVHPAKIEVRFRDISFVKSAILHAIRSALEKIKHSASSTVADETLNAFKIDGAINTITPDVKRAFSDIKNDYNYLNPIIKEDKSEEGYQYKEVSASANNIAQFTSAKNQDLITDKIDNNISNNIIDSSFDQPNIDNIANNNIAEDNHLDLGYARCQLFQTYIVAQAKDSMVLVDQHAAHERITYERMKEAVKNQKVVTQGLLVPEIIELCDIELDNLLDKQEELAKLGLVYEKFGNNAIAVRETPALFGNLNIQMLIKDIVKDIAEYDQILSFNDRVEHILGTMSCHGSIRAGRNMSIDDMNELLRQMEKTNFSGQCNHGRPTYVKLDIAKIEKLFGRR